MNPVNKSSMFTNLIQMPDDPILGLMNKFTDDPRENKIDLGIGVYRNEQGVTPIMSVVKKAETLLQSVEKTKTYTSVAGEINFTNHILAIALGVQVDDLENALPGDLANRGFACVQTVGGTGGVSIAAGIIKNNTANASIWISDPTWANHASIVNFTGLSVSHYPYWNAEKRSLDLENMLDALKQARAGDAVLLHACCHNPTGIDPAPEQWLKIAKFLQKQNLIPVVDAAYLGFGDGLEKDNHGLKTLLEYCPELIFAISCSKNFGMYCERVGMVCAVTENKAAATPMLSQMTNRIRGNYSIPPSHGARVINTILSNPELAEQWRQELNDMRLRIISLREALIASLKAAGCPQSFKFIRGQKGMFSYTGMSIEQVHALRSGYGIYMLDDGRINIAGLTKQNINYVSSSFTVILKSSEL
jgi:aspartate/tyrosine/aromatic aminotransferase